METVTHDSDQHLREWVHLDQDFVCSGPLTPDSTLSPVSTPGPLTPDSTLFVLPTPPFPFVDTAMQGSPSVPLYSSFDKASVGYDSRYGPQPGYLDYPMSSSSQQYNAYPSPSLLLSSSNQRLPLPQFDLDSVPEYASDAEEGLEDLDNLHRLPQLAAPPNYNLAIPLSAYRPIDARDYLCRHLKIPRGSPVDLSSLTENALGEPECTLYIAVAVAIYSSPHKVLTLGGIRDALSERFPGLQTAEAWQASVRHSLSFQAVFVKIIRPPTFDGRGFLWGLDVSRAGLKRARKRRSASERAEAARQAAEAKHAADAVSKTPARRRQETNGQEGKGDIDYGPIGWS